MKELNHRLSAALAALLCAVASTVGGAEPEITGLRLGQDVETVRKTLLARDGSLKLRNHAGMMAIYGQGPDRESLRKHVFTAVVSAESAGELTLVYFSPPPGGTVTLAVEQRIDVPFENTMEGEAREQFVAKLGPPSWSGTAGPNQSSLLWAFDADGRRLSAAEVSAACRELASSYSTALQSRNPTRAGLHKFFPRGGGPEPDCGVTLYADFKASPVMNVDRVDHVDTIRLVLKDLRGLRDAQIAAEKEAASLVSKAPTRQ